MRLCLSVTVDPTAGPSASDQSTWYLDESTLSDNIKKTLHKFCGPSPVVFRYTHHVMSIKSIEQIVLKLNHLHHVRHKHLFIMTWYLETAFFSSLLSIHNWRPVRMNLLLCVLRSDVNSMYLSSTEPPAAAEWACLLRPLRGREPEGIWNLLSIVREMFKRRDSNAAPLLEILTEQCLTYEQVSVSL